MKIFVSAKPGSKKQYIKKIDETHFIVAVKETPEHGKANEALIKALSRYFGVGISNIEIISGHTSRRKILKVYL